MNDLIESLVNAFVGLLVSFTLTISVLGYTPVQSAAVTAMFFVASFLRAWIVRAIFRRIG